MSSLAGASAAVAAGLLAWHLAPRAHRWCPPGALAAVALASGAAAATAPAAPTGSPVVDAVLPAVVAAGLVVLGAHASAVAIALGALVACAASLGSPLGWAAGAAFGISATTVLTTRHAPLAGAVGAALLTQAALRLAPGPPALVTAGAAVLALVPLVLSGGRRLDARVRRLVRRLVRRAGLTAGAFSAVAGLLGLAAALQALPSLGAGEREASLAMAAARRSDAAGAVEGLGVAARHLAVADAALSSWWSRPALAVPVVAQQLRAASAMAATGSELATAASGILADGDLTGVGIVDGRLPVELVSALGEPSARAVRILDRAGDHLHAARSPWLAPPLATRFARLERWIADGRRQAETVELAARVAPGLLGRGGGRRFFLAVQNPAEMRATGGIVGNFGEVTAVDGRLELTRFGRAMDLNLGGAGAARTLEAPVEYRERYRSFHPEQVWQNVNASPDFPTVARVIAGLYPQSGGQPVDGVISVDPAGLAALLKVVGPIEVAGWPEPITEANAERILLHDQYVRYPTIQRVDFLSDTATAIWSALTTGTLPGGIPHLVSALGPAVQGGHVLMWSASDDEQRLLDRLGVAGAVPAPSADALGVVTQNAGGNKIDWFLQRHVDYRASVDEDTGAIDATVDIRLRNDAPSSGLPPLVIASSGRARTAPGENLLYLSVYTPWGLEGAEVDGRPAALEAHDELGRRVYSTYLAVPSGGTGHVRLRLSGRLPPATPYRLDVLRQVTIRPDVVTTSLEEG